MNARTLLSVALVAGCSLFSTVLFADVTYYVRPAATGETIDGGSGTEADPFHHPQMAINAASGTELTTILLASGTYAGWTNAYKVIYSKDVCDEYRVANITKSNIHMKPWDKAAEKPVLGVKKTGYSRNLQIASGLTNVVVSGLKMTGGHTDTNQTKAPRTTSILAYSGAIEDCTIIGYHRKRCSFVTLDGPVIFRRCELTEASNASHETGGGNNTMCPLVASGGALVDTCYVHDMKYGGSTKMNACSGQGISASGSGTIVRNTIVKNIENGTTGAAAGSSGDGGCGAGMAVGSGALVENCTVVGCKNLSNQCGGIYVSGTGQVRNCIVWNNTSYLQNDTTRDILLASGVSADQVTYSDASTGVASGENGNMASDPDFLADGVQISTSSPLGGKGLVDTEWMETAKDWFNNNRLYQETVSMGAMEPQGRVIVFKATPKIVGASFGAAPFEATVDAEVTGASGTCSYLWNFGDGSMVVTSAEARVSHTYTQVKHYTVSLTVEDDNGPHVCADTVAFDAVGDTCYVKSASVGEPPYDTWEKATSNIQAAVELCPKTVLVSNGTYRVSFEKDKFGLKLYAPIRLVSVNGASKTVIRGDLSAPSDSIARNLINMTNAQASVEGFTFRYTRPPMIVATAGRFVDNVVSNSYTTYDNECCLSFSGTVGVTNCLFDGHSFTASWMNWAGCFVRLSGQATMDRCVVRDVNIGGNRWNDTLHAGVNISGSAKLRNCLIDGMTFENSYKDQAYSYKNWLVYASGGFVENCTIRNANIFGSQVCQGAGLSAESAATIRNVISISNRLATASSDGFNDFVGSPNVFENNLIGAGTLPASAVDCLPVGTDPQFVDDGAGYRITKDSPCYNAGKNLGWCRRKGMAKDLDGQERHCNRPDIGCFEVQRNLGLQLIVR